MARGPAFGTPIKEVPVSAMAVQSPDSQSSNVSFLADVETSIRGSRGSIKMDAANSNPSSTHPHEYFVQRAANVHVEASQPQLPQSCKSSLTLFRQLLKCLVKGKNISTYLNCQHIISILTQQRQ